MFLDEKYDRSLSPSSSPNLIRQRPRKTVGLFYLPPEGAKLKMATTRAAAKRAAAKAKDEGKDDSSPERDTEEAPESRQKSQQISEDEKPRLMAAIPRSFLRELLSESILGEPPC